MSETSDLIRNFNESIERSTKEANAWGSLLSSNARLQQQINAATASDLADDEKLSKFIEESADGVKKVTQGVLSFGKNLSDGAGSFLPLTKIVSLASTGISAAFGKIPLIGPVIKGFTEAGEKATNFMIEQYEAAYSTFERVSQSGVVGSFSTFKESASIMALSFQDYEKVIAKNSKDIALLGGGAINGRKMIEGLGAGSETLRTEFAKLGLSTAESTEFQMSFLLQQQKLNKGRLQITDDTIAATGGYIKELELLSRLTGQTRSQIDSARQERMNNSVYRVTMDSANIPKEAKEAIPNALDLINTGRKEMEEANISILAASTQGTQSANEQAKTITNIFNAGGKDVYKLFKQLSSGEIDQIEFSKQYAEGLKTGVEALAKQTAVAPEQRPEYKYYADALDMQKRLSGITKESVEEEKRKIEEQTKEERTLNANMAKMRQDLYKTGNAIQKLSVEADFVPAAIEMLSDTLYGIVDKAYELSGAEMPANIKAQSDLRKSTKTRIEAEKNLLDTEKKLADFDGLDPEAFSASFAIHTKQIKQLTDAQAAETAAKQKSNDVKNGVAPTVTSAKTDVNLSQSEAPIRNIGLPAPKMTQEEQAADNAYKAKNAPTSLPMSTPSPPPVSFNNKDITNNVNVSNKAANILGDVTSQSSQNSVTDVTETTKQALGSPASTITNTNDASKNFYSEVFEKINSNFKKLTSLMTEQQSIQQKLIETRNT